MDDVLDGAIRKAAWRLMPFLCLLYLVNYLDRVNISFAALTMNSSLGLSATVFGIGAGMFFVGYVVCEVPSNLVLARVGARRWIGRIMVTWGVIAVAMAMVSGRDSFYVTRLLLGVAEAGFFPGILYFITRWFPAASRAGIISLFMVGMPASSVLGAPISTTILARMDGLAGLAGWQWLFIVEGLPAVVLGLFCFRVLADRPGLALWLTPAEQTRLEQVLVQERSTIRTTGVREGLLNPRVLALSLLFFLVTCGLYGTVFWMPQIVRTFGVSTLANGFITALPYALSVMVMVLWGRHSDATGERTWHVAIPVLFSATGFVVASLWLDRPVIAMAGLSAACIGIYSTLPVFWTLPGRFLTGPAIAGAFALITSLGNLSGIVIPPIVGWTKDATGGFTLAMAGLACALVLAGLLAFACRSPQQGRLRAAEA
jgi:ACS family tartrate transporter-like MFS transporter